MAGLYLSLDETGQIHDNVLPNFIHLVGRKGVPHLLWIPAAVIAVTMFGLSYLRFVRALPRATRNQLCAAAICYVGGAIACEMIGGLYVSLYGMQDFTYALLAACEEGLEMLGIALYLRVLMRYYSATMSIPIKD